MAGESVTKSRKGFIGGSDISSVVDLNPFKTKLQLYLEKRGLTEPEDESDAMRLGKKLEHIVKEEYILKSGNLVGSGKIMIDENFSFMAGHSDGYVVNGEGKPVKGVEFKTTSEFAFSGKWGEEYTDEIPMNYYLQVQWYMMLDGMPSYDVAVLVGGRKLKIYHVERNVETILKLRNEARAFWNGNVLAKEPPPAEAGDGPALATLYPEEKIHDCTAESDTIKLLRKLETFRNIRKSAEANEETIKNQIKSHMKDAGLMLGETGDRFYTVTWRKTQDGAPKPDWKAIAVKLLEQIVKPEEFDKAMNKLIGNHQTAGRKGVRRFTFNAKKKLGK